MNIQEDKSNATPEPSIMKLIKGEFEKRKQQLAMFLTNQSQRLPPRCRTLLFLLIGVVLSITITVISYKAVLSTSFFEVIQNGRPLPFQSEPLEDEEIVTPEEYNIIQNFNYTLDSLQQRDPVSYRQLMQLHPGIRDSIQLLMHIYTSTH